MFQCSNVIAMPLVSSGDFCLRISTHLNGAGEPAHYLEIRDTETQEKSVLAKREFAITFADSIDVPPL